MSDIAKKQMRNCKDRISDLPDSLLLHILSFLELREVITTSILSRRWRFLWTSVPNLDLGTWIFDEHMHNGKLIAAGCSDIPTAINTSLMLYDSPKIHKFRANFDYPGFSSCYDLTDSNIDKWFRFATKHCVEEFELKLYNCGHKAFLLEDGLLHYEVPGSLSDCGSLKVLKLTYCELNLRSPLRLCLLKKLELRHAKLSDLNTSGCPSLECLILKNCNSWDHLNIYAPNQKLRYLEIHDSYAVTDSDDSFSELDRSLTLFAPNLLSIQFRGFIRRAYNIKSLSSLRRATFKFLDMKTYVETDEYPQQLLELQLVELLVNVSHASTLELCSWCIEFFSCLQVPLPPLRATYLALQTITSKSELLGMASVLCSSQNLESLIIHNEINLCSDVVFDETCGSLELYLSTNCQLKTVEINSFLRSKSRRSFREPESSHDIDKFLEKLEKRIIMLVKLLLNCMVLEKLIIRTVKIPACWRLKPVLLLGLKKRLLAFPRASKNAEIYLLESGSLV